MNYFAHAADHLDQPFFVAGLAIPDWLSVVDRRVRARGRDATPLMLDGDREVRQLAAGIVRHHADDRWFHQTRIFTELNLQFAVELRERLGEDAGFRPSFLGHIAIELLLDAVMIADDRTQVDLYYEALRAASPAKIERLVNRIAKTPTDRLRAFIPRFIAERFLYDYLDDGRLLVRLNQVMRRVGLPLLPDSLVPWLADARLTIAGSRQALLTPPAESQFPSHDELKS